MERVLLDAHPYFGSALAGDEAYDPEYHELRVMDMVSAVLGKRWEELGDGDFARLAEVAAKWGAARGVGAGSKGIKGTKARTWVDPYIREGERVAGYWRDVRGWEEVAADIQAQFQKALSTRNKQGYVVRGGGEYWKPPSGWYDRAPLGDGVAQFAAELEYEDGKRAIVYVTARHAGKQGAWNVKVRKNSFEKYPPEIIRIRDRFAAIDPDLSYDEYEEEAKKLVDELGWIEVGSNYMSKYGDYKVKVDHSYGQKAAIAIPAPLDDFERRSRFRHLLDQQDKQEALVVGQTTKTEVENAVGTYTGWRLVDRGDNTFDLLYRREGREADELEVKGYRVTFDDQGVLTDVGLPGENAAGMATEDEYKAMVRAQRAEAKRLENERNERVVGITSRLREALNGMPDLPPPEKVSELRKNNRGTTVSGLEVGDRFSVKTKVYEVTGVVGYPYDLPATQYNPDDFEERLSGSYQDYAGIDAFDEGDFIKRGTTERVYKVVPRPQGWPEDGYSYSKYAIQDVETGEISDPGLYNFSLLDYKHEGIMAAPVSGRGSGVSKTFEKRFTPEKVWQKKLADRRVGGESDAAQMGRGADLQIDGADWDEVREALSRMNFQQVKRYNKKVAGQPAHTSYTEVWRRGITGSEVKFTVRLNRDKETPSRMFRDWLRPYSGWVYEVVPGETRVSRGTDEADRTRIKGRVPKDKEEWRSDMLGRADELADHYGETSEATLIVFADQERIRSRSLFGDDNWQAPPDMNAYIDGSGVIVLGEDVLPALQAYSDAVAKGEVTDEIRDKAWRAWATAQHEINHSVNRAAGYWGGYSDSDGTKNFEETLTEELARVMVNEWARSASATDIADWAQDNAANLGVQGAYQTFRTNFKNLLDLMEVPEEERMALLERWKFNTNWKKRMQEFSEMLSDHLDISVEEAEQKVKEVLSANRLNNGNTEGVLRVQEFRPILKVGPMPPRRPASEIERLRNLVKPLRDNWVRLRDQWRAMDGPSLPDRYLTDEGKALKAALVIARAAYFSKLEEFDLAPVYEDYA